MRTRSRTTSSARPGFTLAEVAVTIMIVGIGLLLVLQGLTTAKLTAAHTRNLKLARELALITLGQVASGEFQDDVENGLQGSYADEGYPDFTFEVIVGDETFRPKTANGVFDSWAPPEDTKSKSQDEEDPKEKEEPFEKVKIRITFPQVREFTNELILENWIPWKQVYGEKPEDEAATAAAQGQAGGQPAGGTATGGSSSGAAAGGRGK